MCPEFFSKNVENFLEKRKISVTSFSLFQPNVFKRFLEGRYNRELYARDLVELSEKGTVELDKLIAAAADVLPAMLVLKKLNVASVCEVKVAC